MNSCLFWPPAFLPSPKAQADPSPPAFFWAMGWEKNSNLSTQPSPPRLMTRGRFEKQIVAQTRPNCTLRQVWCSYMIFSHQNVSISTCGDCQLRHKSPLQGSSSKRTRLVCHSQRLVSSLRKRYSHECLSSLQLQLEIMAKLFRL